MKLAAEMAQLAGRMRPSSEEMARIEAEVRKLREDGVFSQEERERIVAALGREPNLVELGIFSVMWSEHCSYKSSRVHLKTLPTTGKRVLQGPGENAGAVDIGDGLCAVFKIESHNHPSFIEPYQGAATGVGGSLYPRMRESPIVLTNSAGIHAAPTADRPLPHPSCRCVAREVTPRCRSSTREAHASAVPSLAGAQSHAAGSADWRKSASQSSVIRSSLSRES